MGALNRAELGTWRRLVIILATVVVVACSSKTSRDADWEDVQKAATRVESGLRHETLIALRSKVADLDAAVANYTRHHADGQKEQRVRSINQAVDALEWGIDHEKADVIWDGTDGFEFYATRQYLNTEPKCAESTGKLYISGRDMSLACLAYAQSALLEPEKLSPMSQHDFNALRSKCGSDHEKYQQQTQEKAAAARAEHLRKWPLQIDITTSGEFDFGYEIDSETDNHGVLVLRKGMRKHIEARHTVRILAFNNLYDEAEITVNGRAWTPEWTPNRHDVFDLETTITVSMLRSKSTPAAERGECERHPEDDYCRSN